MSNDLWVSVQDLSLCIDFHHRSFNILFCSVLLSFCVSHHLISLAMMAVHAALPCIPVFVTFLSLVLCLR